MTELNQIKNKLLRSHIDGLANKLGNSLARLESTLFKLDDIFVKGIVRPELIETTFRLSASMVTVNLSYLRTWVN